MPSTSASHTVIFIAALTASVVLTGGLVTNAQFVGGAVDERGSSAAAQIETDVEFISDPESPESVYNDTTETVTLLVKNTGGRDIRADSDALTVLIDGEYAHDANVTVVGDPNSTAARPGDVLRITVDRTFETADHRLTVRAGAATSAMQLDVAELIAEDGSVSGEIFTDALDRDQPDLDGETIELVDGTDYSTSIQSDGTYDFGTVEGDEYTLRIDPEDHRVYETTVLVDGNVTENATVFGNVENVDQGTTYAEIRNAEPDANVGETLELAPATYDRNVSATAGVALQTDGLTLRSERGRSVTTIDANGSDVGIDVSAPNVTLDGVTVRNTSSIGVVTTAGDGLLFRDSRVYVDLATGANEGLYSESNVTVSNTHFEANPDSASDPFDYNYGVKLRTDGANGSRLEGLTVEHFGNNVYLEQVATPTTLRDLTIRNGGNGVLVEDSSDATLSGVEATDTAQYGIDIVRAGSVDVDGATVLRNPTAGIHVYDSSLIDIADSSVRNNSAPGVFGVISDNVSVTGSSLEENNDGVKLTDSVDSVARDNYVLNNTYNGVIVQADNQDVYNVTVRYNDLVGNGNYGIYAEDTGSNLGSGSLTENVDGRNDWWGNADGPEHSDSDNVSANVDYEPWLDEPKDDDTAALVNFPDQTAGGSSDQVDVTIESIYRTDSVYIEIVDVDGNVRGNRTVSAADTYTITVDPAVSSPAEDLTAVVYDTDAKADEHDRDTATVSA